MNYIVKVADF